jgi:hypothetical protein
VSPSIKVSRDSESFDIPPPTLADGCNEVQRQAVAFEAKVELTERDGIIGRVDFCHLADDTTSVVKQLTVNDEQEIRQVMDSFAEFAHHEGQGYAPLYEQLCAIIATDPALASLLLEAPYEQRRHTLYLAALHDLVLDYPDKDLAMWYPTVSNDPRLDDPEVALRSFCEKFEMEMRDLISTRRTQTNEIGRSAVLHPALSWALNGDSAPVFLIDLGASAGLNLLVDRWRYAYSDGTTRGEPTSPIGIPCELRGTNPLPPVGLPAIAGRVGIDLNPVDSADPDQTRWLQACVFADQRDRFDRLTKALELARQSSIDLRRGDIVDLVPEVIAALPDNATVCVTSTWTLAYLDPLRRKVLYESLVQWGETKDVHLIVGEPSSVVEEFAPTSDLPSEATVWAHTRYSTGATHQTLLGYSHPHGTWLDWRAPSEP